MSIDMSTHSLFGASKVAADILVQEYGRYFDMPTVCFRAGCLTGPNHAGAQAHGFLSYLMRCTVTGQPYTVFGYGGKQVRDNLHSADVVAAFAAFHRDPRPGAVYNLGGGRYSNCSLIEAVDMAERIAGETLQRSYDDTARTGDHRWWISDLAAFQRDYPSFMPRYGVEDILRQIHDANADKWRSRVPAR
jgi:CDP-paratose 2-epimerase